MHSTTCTYVLYITDKWCGGNKAHTVVTWFHSGSGEMVQVSQRVIRVSHLNRVHKAGHVQAGRDTQGQRQDAEPRGQLHVTAPTPTLKAVVPCRAARARGRGRGRNPAPRRRSPRRRREGEGEGEGKGEAGPDGSPPDTHSLPRRRSALRSHITLFSKGSKHSTCTVLLALTF